MFQVRKAKARGHANHGWLDSYHTFSFADYYDPEHMGFGFLRVINEDVIAGGRGFGAHPHRDMEIVTYIIDGALEHKDSMGNTKVIKPGEVQRMSAGTGVQHSEFNHYADRPTHLLQIWILPEKSGLPPSYEQTSFTDALKENNFVLALARDGRQGAVSLHQDVSMYIGKFKADDQRFIVLSEGRKAWVQMISGELEVSGNHLQSGDGLAIQGEKAVSLKANGNTDFLFFDLI